VASSSLWIKCALSALVAGAMLAGCGGSQTQAGLLGPIQNGSPTMVSPSVKGHCAAHGGVRVDPCTVDFTASSPGPDTVTVRNPKSKKGTLTESDTCGGPSGIATLSANGNQWTVTAGSTTGSCTAEFDYTNHHGKIVGSAVLSITNAI
jgi:hypothetical protein